MFKKKVQESFKRLKKDIFGNEKIIALNGKSIE